MSASLFNGLPALIVSDVARRGAAVREALVEQELDYLVVTKPVNIRWLCGFNGSNGTLLIGVDGIRLITDSRYDQQAHTQLAAAGVEAEIEIAPNGVAGLVARHVGGGATVGLEADHVTWNVAAEYERCLGAVTVVATSGLIETLRQHKDPGERSRLERASAIADRALLATIPLFAERPTEQQFGAALDHAMRQGGADDVSFETIVASGPNGALPHHRPGSRVIEADDLVVIDFGAKVDGYGSDMTRTFVAGGNPSVEQQRLYDAVAAAQAAGVAAVRDGADQRSIDTTCRDVLGQFGLAEAFIHGTGHGLGLEIHEQPILSARSVGILTAGLIVTVEPGAYLPGFGGVRVEDTVVVTNTGCVPITHCPKGLDPAAVARANLSEDASHGQHDHE